MSKLYDLKEIVESTGLPERTVRYYLAKVLQASGGTPGRKSYYDQITVDQLILAQQILMREYDPNKGEVKPTLKEFREWVDALSEEEIRELVEMPYRIKPKSLISSGLTTSLSKSSLSSRLETPMSMAPQSIDREDLPGLFEMSEEDKKGNQDTAADYLNRVMGPQRPAQRFSWQTHTFGPDLQIRTRNPLTSEQQQQLLLTGQLLQNILEGQRR